MKKILILLIFFVFAFSISNAQKRNITRGASNGEMYITNLWYGIGGPIFYDTLQFAIYRLTEYGKKLTIQYNGDYFYGHGFVVRPGCINADATIGVLYNECFITIQNIPYYTQLWVSFDYGKNWELRDEIIESKNYVSANVNGLIFRHGYDGRYKSEDYGFSFSKVEIVSAGSEPGLQYGEAFSVGTDGLYQGKIGHTFNFWETYTQFPIDSQFVFGFIPETRKFPDVYRGGLPGEVYISSWFLGDSEFEYRVSFSDDYGETFRHVYICKSGCWYVDPIMIYIEEFMSDREPGVFYIIKQKFVDKINPWGFYIQICIDYYRDYGDTFVATYCHDIHKNYGAICEPVNNLTAEQYIGNNVMLKWQDNSSLPVDSFLVYRNSELVNSKAGNENFYLDENLEIGYYEYFVVAHYVTGCISDISIVVNVFVEEMYEITFEVKDNETLPISEANIAINDTELTTDEQGVTSIYLIDGNYSYIVSKTGYIETDGNITVADEPQTVIITMEKESFQITFEVKDINTLPIFEALISINNEVLLTDNQGIAFISLFDDEYFYKVSKAGYFDIDSVLTVSGAPQTIFLEMEDWSSIEELRIKNYELRIYPNPTTGELFVEIAGDPESSSGRRSALPLGSAKNDIKNIEMFDVFGRNVGVQFSPSFGGGRGEVSHLSAGFYFVRITTKNGIVIKKVVKQ